ncbi:MAG: rhomboid family intramembrane serine protease [Flavobacterium circumlabens]|uniref:Membrane associated rhomboid family serine protease n=1 Tax=Flavobacterium circumlabens TaxID=2133765 RepID=A0A4Y7UAS3_9FLAO|nr:rhomboid family intramembrane serine protease [Flavobacterium circumlabens]TCN56492.1 membrane associated rhomboid family serine protease [Flavobacterium circumlabens]TEB43520.1 rhomboid family intramembrane serine protease [Flavobacterium circumlabens]
MMNMTPVVKQLLIINIIFFIGSQLVPVSYEYFAMFFPENPSFKAWQPITHMFMHGGILHIAFNMFAMVSFGSALEHFWGPKKFLFFYISCGLGAALLHTGVNYYFFQDSINTLIANGYNKTAILQLLNEGKIDTRWQELLTVSQFESFTGAYMGTVVGASGAIYGLLTAFAFMFPNAELALMFIPVPIKAKYFVPGILAIDLFLGFRGNSLFGSGGTGVAHFAHLGGAITGFLMMLYWKKNQFNKNRWN